MRFLLVLLVLTNNLFAQKWLQVKAKSGDTRIILLKKHKLTDQCSKDKFLELNKMNSKDFLIKGKAYKMPVKVYAYNGKSIRTTIGISNYDQARALQNWNEALVANSIKSKSYVKGGVLWVPYFLLSCYEKYGELSESSKKTLVTSSGSSVGGIVTHKIFGSKYERVKIVSKKLEGKIYYLVSGHGGPDPGAVGKYQNKSICEDEYAYDVILRLGKRLIEQGATVYHIVKDPNDGIRDVSLLKCDKDEVTYPNKKMPVNQVKRLNQRVESINALYRKHKKKGAKFQRMIVIHIDSRSEGSRVDMFFYHYGKSSKGKTMANTMYLTVKAKYDQYQKGRGYKGTVKSRNLHMLRKSLPAGVYIELGNIQNPADQKRFTVVENREAMAKWFADALRKL